MKINTCGLLEALARYMVILGGSDVVREVLEKSGLDVDSELAEVDKWRGELGRRLGMGQKEI